MVTEGVGMPLVWLLKVSGVGMPLVWLLKVSVWCRYAIGVVT